MNRNRWNRYITLLSFFVLSACSFIGSPASNNPITTPTEVPSPTNSENLEEPGGQPTESLSDNDATGVVYFQDNLAAMDMMLVTTLGLPPRSDEKVYKVWLIGDDGSAENIGSIQISPDGSGSLTYTSPTGENLLAAHNRVEITIDNEVAVTPAESTIIDGSYTQEELKLLRTLMVRNNGSPPTPRSKPFIEGLKSQFDLALQHIQNAVNANAIGASDQAQVHLEHVINILDGSEGALFRDYTQDGVAENPGDGFGMLPYVRQVSEILDTPEISMSADTLETQIFDLQLEIIAVIDIGLTTESLEGIASKGHSIQTGAFAILINLIQQVTAMELTPKQ